MTNILGELRRDLSIRADEKTRISGEKFFREGVKLYGIRNAAVHSLSRDYYKKLPEKSKIIVFNLCEQLWQSGYNEEAFFACNWSYAVRKQFTADDIVTFERWIDSYVTNWATCDTFCNHTVGEFIMQFPESIGSLKIWAGSKNRWMRRAAAVSLIIPARRGKFLKEIFEIATIMLTDTDDMVQKGYGWMLKAASEAHQKEVYDFVTGNKNLIPRTAYRYALEKMTAEMRAEAMKK